VVRYNGPEANTGVRMGPQFIRKNKGCFLKDRYFGFDLLRVCAALLVIYRHVPNGLDSLIYIDDCFEYLTLLAVPSFIVMSFFLTGESMLRGISTFTLYLVPRLKRLIIPLIIWSILGFLLWPTRISCKGIMLQLCFSSVVNFPLWYLSIMVYLSVLIWGLCRSCPKKYWWPISIVLFTLCYLAQYTGANSYLVTSYIHDPIIQFRIGRFVEVFPFVLIGVFLRYREVHYKFRNDIAMHLWSVRIVCLLFIVSGLCLHLSIKPLGFTYQGVGLLLGTGAIFIFVMTFPIYGEHKRFAIVLHGISSVTLGIYCSHFLVHNIVLRLMGGSNLYNELTKIPLLYGLLLFAVCFFCMIVLKSVFRERFSFLTAAVS
jgi:acyltransferase-like protein